MRPSIMHSRGEPRRDPTEHWWAVLPGAVLLAYALGLVAVPGVPVWLTAVAAVAPLGLLVWGYLKRPAGSAFGELTIVEALSLVASAFVISRWLGVQGLEGFGLVLLALTAVLVLSSTFVALGAVGAIVSTEALSQMLQTAAPTQVGLTWTGLEGVDVGMLATRLSMVAAFALLAWLVVGREAARKRKARDQELEREREKLLAEAREFRLIHAGRSDSPVTREQAEELILRDAVEAVHHTTFVTLELVQTALRAHTVVLLWFDLRNEKLRIKELISESDDLVEGTIDPAGGVLGGISRRREVVRLSSLRPGFRGLAYYRTLPGITEFVGVPIIEQGHLRGILCVDRCENLPFTEREVQIVEDSASYILRGVENERMVASIERTRFEVGRFFEASRRLNSVLTPEEVYKVALESVREICDVDFGAVTLYDAQEDRHEVVYVDGDGAKSRRDSWEKFAFDSNQGLVSMVIRNRHYLPVGGRLRDRRATVLTEEEDFSGLPSLLVLPLIVQDQVVGTLVVGHSERDRFPAQRREMLEVIANQVAVTVQNARLYAQMETMAKYDALTNLPNRRSFTERLQQTMARHRRNGRTFGLVLTDIDHFKNVNDTYGHPVGDEVLRQVGRLFREELREVDLPARYGGEEFVMILEDTDLEGARQVANRLREAVARLCFQTEKGPLQCTISMGIALGPWDSDEPHTLVDLADQALYYSKENGRNQVSVYREVVASSSAA